MMSKINKSIKCVFIRHPSQKFELNNHDMLSFGQGKAFGEVREKPYEFTRKSGNFFLESLYEPACLENNYILQ